MNATEAPGARTAPAADFPGWHVWRSRDGCGREGDWNATWRRMPRPAPPGITRRVTAADAIRLRGFLEQQQTAEAEPTPSAA